MSSAVTISAFFDKDVPRYGDSFVFKAYKLDIQEREIGYSYFENNAPATSKDIESDLGVILEYYRKAVSVETTSPTSTYSQGIFYIEKQLEDFIIYNWDKTELGKKYELIVEDGELISQQFRTDTGPIDILAREKSTKSYVVIELKKNQTSDDTVGQLTRYMGWVREKKNDKGVRGVIIAGEYDRRLDYALQMIHNCEVFLYEVDFKLKKFQK